MALWTLKNNKILVVDDFAEMRSMLRSMLRAYGAEDILQASNGEDAIAKIENHKFDIILCDYNLGEGKDGQQVLEEAKHRDILPLATTFIMVTAENTSMMVMGALDYQPDAYLSKPITKTTLQTRLKRVLDKKELTKNISSATDKKEFSKAIKLCGEAIISHPPLRLELLKLKYNLLMTTADYSIAEKTCEEALTDRNVPWAQLGLAKVYFYQQKYNEAKILLEEIIKENNHFIIAYDWLSKTQKKLGDLKAAEEAITKAIEKSPKSLPRQRELGELATKNENHTVAERARRDAMMIGKHSELKRPDDYVYYAQTLIKNNKSKEALKVAGNIQRVFKGNNEAKLQSEVCKSTLFQANGDDKKSQEAMNAALSLYNADDTLAASSACIALAKSCLKYGLQDDASAIIKNVAKNNHGNEAVLNEINQTYEEAGLGNTANEMIAEAVKEIAEINNQGVKLISDGKITDSIEFFKKAAKALPLNHVICLNTAQSYILLMKKEGASNNLVKEAMRYLNMVKDIDAAREKHDELMKNCREIAQQAGL